MSFAASDASPAARAELGRTRRYVVLAAILSLAYALGHLTWYLGTPLGQVPVLDERENILLAHQIVDGALTAEPFYRAMGYPLVLAGFLWAGLPTGALVTGALVFGAILHAINAYLTGRLAGQLFNNWRAAVLAALLTGLNPVLLHYAVSVLDATLATTFFLLGCCAFYAGTAQDQRAPEALFTNRRFLFVGPSWALAALVRPQFLPLLVTLPLLTWVRERSRKALLIGTVAAALGGLFFLADGVWSQRTSGKFRVLPWQGTYNLWAANKPGAHGRYFVQTSFVASNPGQENPTKLETFALYEKETGQKATDIDVVNAYWAKRFRADVLAHPIEWSGRLARKTYALFNNWEQYNNKTYAFHKNLSPWLRWNPLGWGLLLLFAVPGTWLLIRARPDEASALLVIFGLYAGGVILYFVSARFRLPLVNLLAIPAAGALVQWRAACTLPRWHLVRLLALLAAISFSRFSGVHDEKPFLQDHLLLARAAQRVGDDVTALSEARTAASLAPRHPEATELMITSWFNLALTTGTAPDADLVSAARGIGEAPEKFAPGTAAVAGILLAKVGDRATATKIWHARPSLESTAALVLSGEATPDQAREILGHTILATDSVLVRLAQTRVEDRPVLARQLSPRG